MAKKFSTIFSVQYMTESIKRQGVLKSIEAGLKLISLRSKNTFFKTKFGRAVSIFIAPSDTTSSVLNVFYDLAVSAPGYDIVNFLVLAEKYRIEKGYRKMHITFVPPEGESTKKYMVSKKLLDSADYLTRLQAILAPACYLFESANGYTVCTDRKTAHQMLGSNPHVFPEKYTVQGPVSRVKLRYFREAIDRGESIPSISAPLQMKIAAERWLKSVAGNKKPVTITLRESTYVQDRNSNVDAWGRFAQELQKSDTYFPIIIRDTERVAEPLPASLEGLTTCPEASMHVLYRTAIYEKSHLNLMVNNGTAMLCFFNKDIKYLYFKVVTESNPSATVEFLRNDQGMYVNEPFPGSTPYQKLVWEDDSLDVIQKEFEAMCRLIEKG